MEIDKNKASFLNPIVSLWKVVERFGTLESLERGMFSQSKFNGFFFNIFFLGEKTFITYIFLKNFAKNKDSVITSLIGKG